MYLVCTFIALKFSGGGGLSLFRTETTAKNIKKATIKKKEDRKKNTQKSNKKTLLIQQFSKPNTRHRMHFQGSL